MVDVEPDREDVGEVSVRADDRRDDPVDGGAGWYRVRAHARGRDLMFDLVAEEPVEDYLVIAWPADPAVPESLRVTAARFSMAVPSAPTHARWANRRAKEPRSERRDPGHRVARVPPLPARASGSPGR